MKSFNLILSIFFTIILTLESFSQELNVAKIQSSTSNNSLISKKGGISFRTDDNSDIEHFNALASIFDNYNLNHGREYHIGYALNLGEEEFLDTAYINGIKTLQLNGHEMMDHTPNHRTNFFNTIFPETDYIVSGIPIPGVDHIVDNKICIKYKQADITKAKRTGYCNIQGETISGTFTDFDYWDDIYLYFEGIDTLVFIEKIEEGKTKIIIKDIWEDPIDLGTHSNVIYHNFTLADIHLTIDGIKVLAKESQKLASLYGFDSLRTWIQPGGRHPDLHADEIKEACGDSLGYIAGAIYPNASIKVFNEYDPNNSMAFGMQWGDFQEDLTNWDLDRCKNVISDGIAKHETLVGHNHFYTLIGDYDAYETKDGYFEKVDSILAWCNTNDIPVRTYSEWAEILYNQTADPYENIFPPLNVSLNNETNEYTPNGRPDGYYLRYWEDNGIWETDPDAPSEGNYCYSITDEARLFRIDDLAGLEKGENDFEIWTKGGVGDSIIVLFSYIVGTSTQIETFKFPADSSAWTKYNLSHSTSGKTNLNIPESVSTVTVEVKCSDYNSGDTVKVSGMYLAKKKPSISLDLKLFLEGVYSDSNFMSTSSNFQNIIPKNQPFNTIPWNYDIDESVQSIPNDVIDWVLVELRSTMEASSVITRKAGFIKNDGNIINIDGSDISFNIGEGNYYVLVYHGNHLPVMSSTPITFQ